MAKKDKEKFDSARLEHAENYLKQNLGRYPLGSLKNALLAGGYSEAEVEEASKSFTEGKTAVQKQTSNPLDVAFLLQNTWSFFKEHLVLLFSIQFVAAVPSMLLQIINQEPIAGINRINESDPELLLGQFRDFSSIFFTPFNILLILSAVVFSVWGVVSLYRAIIDLDQGEELDFPKAYRNATPFILPYVGAAILYGLALVFGIILLIVPGIIFAGWFIFFGFTVTYEKKGAVAALKRSKELVQGYWWGIVGRYLLGILIVGVASALPGILSYIPFVGPIFQGIIQAIAGTFMIVYLYNIYKGLRVIKG